MDPAILAQLLGQQKAPTSESSSGLGSEEEEEEDDDIHRETTREIIRLRAKLGMKPKKRFAKLHDDILDKYYNKSDTEMNTSTASSMEGMSKKEKKQREKELKKQVKKVKKKKEKDERMSSASGSAKKMNATKRKEEKRSNDDRLSDSGSPSERSGSSGTRETGSTSSSSSATSSTSGMGSSSSSRSGSSWQSSIPTSFPEAPFVPMQKKVIKDKSLLNIRLAPLKPRQSMEPREREVRLMVTDDWLQKTGKNRQLKRFSTTDESMGKSMDFDDSMALGDSTRYDARVYQHNLRYFFTQNSHERYLNIVKEAMASCPMLRQQRFVGAGSSTFVPKSEKNEQDQQKPFSMLKHQRALAAILKDKVYTHLKNAEMIASVKKELAEGQAQNEEDAATNFKMIMYEQLFYPVNNTPASLMHYARQYNYLLLPSFSVNSELLHNCISYLWRPNDALEPEPIKFDNLEEQNLQETIAMYASLLVPPKKMSHQDFNEQHRIPNTTDSTPHTSHHSDSLPPTVTHAHRDEDDELWLFRPGFCRVASVLQPYWKTVRYHVAVTMFDSMCTLFNKTDYLNPGQFKAGLRRRDWAKLFGQVLAAEIAGLKNCGHNIDGDALKFKFFDYMLPTVEMMADNVLDALTDLREMYVLSAQNATNLNAMIPVSRSTIGGTTIGGTTATSTIGGGTTVGGTTIGATTGTSASMAVQKFASMPTGQSRTSELEDDSEIASQITATATVERAIATYYLTRNTNVIYNRPEDNLLGYGHERGVGRRRSSAMSAARARGSVDAGATWSGAGATEGQAGRDTATQSAGVQSAGVTLASYNPRDSISEGSRNNKGGSWVEGPLVEGPDLAQALQSIDIEQLMKTRLNEDLQLFSSVLTQGEYLSSTILEPEWIQFMMMFYDLFDEIFSCYVDFPVIRAKGGNGSPSNMTKQEVREKEKQMVATDKNQRLGNMIHPVEEGSRTVVGSTGGVGAVVGQMAMGKQTALQKATATSQATITTVKFGADTGHSITGATGSTSPASGAPGTMTGPAGGAAGASGSAAPPAKIPSTPTVAGLKGIANAKWKCRTTLNLDEPEEEFSFIPRTPAIADVILKASKNARENGASNVDGTERLWSRPGSKEAPPGSHGGHHSPGISLSPGSGSSSILMVPGATTSNNNVIPLSGGKSPRPPGLDTEFIKSPRGQPAPLRKVQTQQTLPLPLTKPTSQGSAKASPRTDSRLGQKPSTGDRGDLGRSNSPRGTSHVPGTSNAGPPSTANTSSPGGQSPPSPLPPVVTPRLPLGLDGTTATGVNLTAPKIGMPGHNVTITGSTSLGGKSEDGTPKEKPSGLMGTLGAVRLFRQSKERVRLKDPPKTYARHGHMSLASFASFCLDFRLCPQLVNWRTLEWLYRTAECCEVLSEEQALKVTRGNVAPTQRFKKQDHVILISREPGAQHGPLTFSDNCSPNFNIDDADVGTVLESKLTMVRVKSLGNKTGFYHESSLERIVPGKSYWMKKVRAKMVKTPKEPMPQFWSVTDTKYIEDENQKKAYYLISAIDDWIGHRRMNPRKLFWIFRNPLTHDEFWQGLNFLQLRNFPKKFSQEFYDICRALHPETQGEISLDLLDELCKRVRETKMEKRKRSANLFIMNVSWVNRNKGLPTMAERDAQDFFMLLHDKMTAFNITVLEYWDKYVCKRKGGVHQDSASPEDFLEASERLGMKQNAYSIGQMIAIFRRVVASQAEIEEGPGSPKNGKTTATRKSFAAGALAKSASRKTMTVNTTNVHTAQDFAITVSSVSAIKDDKNESPTSPQNDSQRGGEGLGSSHRGGAGGGDHAGGINPAFISKPPREDGRIRYNEFFRVIKDVVSAKQLNARARKRQEQDYEDSPLTGMKPVTEKDLRHFVLLSERANEPKITETKVMVNFDSFAFIECIVKIAIYHLQFCADAVQRTMSCKQIWFISYIYFQHEMRRQELESVRNEMEDGSDKEDEMSDEAKEKEQENKRKREEDVVQKRQEREDRYKELEKDKEVRKFVRRMSTEMAQPQKVSSKQMVGGPSHGGDDDDDFFGDEASTNASSKKSGEMTTYARRGSFAKGPAATLGAIPESSGGAGNGKRLSIGNKRPFVSGGGVQRKGSVLLGDDHFAKKQADKAGQRLSTTSVNSGAGGLRRGSTASFVKRDSMQNKESPGTSPSNRSHSPTPSGRRSSQGPTTSPKTLLKEHNLANDVVKTQKNLATRGGDRDSWSGGSMSLALSGKSTTVPDLGSLKMTIYNDADDDKVKAIVRYPRFISSFDRVLKKCINFNEIPGICRLKPGELYLERYCGIIRPERRASIFRQLMVKESKKNEEEKKKREAKEALSGKRKSISHNRRTSHVQPWQTLRRASDKIRSSSKDAGAAERDDATKTKRQLSKEKAAREARLMPASPSTAFRSVERWGMEARVVREDGEEVEGKEGERKKEEGAGDAKDGDGRPAGQLAVSTSSIYDKRATAQFAVPDGTPTESEMPADNSTTLLNESAAKQTPKRSSGTDQDTIKSDSKDKKVKRSSANSPATGSPSVDGLPGQDGNKLAAPDANRKSVFFTARESYRLDSGMRGSTNLQGAISPDGSKSTPGAVNAKGVLAAAAKDGKNDKATATGKERGTIVAGTVVAKTDGKEEGKKEDEKNEEEEKDLVAEKSKCKVCGYPKYKGWGFLYCWSCSDSSFIMYEQSFPLLKRLIGEFSNKEVESAAALDTHTALGGGSGVLGGGSGASLVVEGEGGGDGKNSTPSTNRGSVSGRGSVSETDKVDKLYQEGQTFKLKDRASRSVKEITRQTLVGTDEGGLENAAIATPNGTRLTRVLQRSDSQRIKGVNGRRGSDLMSRLDEGDEEVEKDGEQILAKAGSKERTSLDANAKGNKMGLTPNLSNANSPNESPRDNRKPPGKNSPVPPTKTPNINKLTESVTAADLDF